MPYYVDPQMPNVIKKRSFLSRLRISDIELSLGDIFALIFPKIKDFVKIKIKLQQEPESTTEKVRQTKGTSFLEKFHKLKNDLNKKGRAFKRVPAQFKRIEPNSSPDTSLLFMYGILNNIVMLDKWEKFDISEERVCNYVLSNYPARMMLYDDPYVSLTFDSSMRKVIKLDWHPHVGVFGLLRSNRVVDVLMLLVKERPDLREVTKVSPFFGMNIIDWVTSAHEKILEVQKICQQKRWRDIDSLYWEDSLLGPKYWEVVGDRPIRCSCMEDLAYDILVLKQIYKLHNFDLQDQETIKGNIELEDLATRIRALEEDLKQLRSCFDANKIITRIPTSFN